MNPLFIVEKAAADGVTLSLSATGTIKAAGDSAAVARWLAAIREQKAEISRVLKIRALVHAIAEHDEWTPDEVDLVLKAAIEDQEDALLCWQSIADGYGITDQIKRRSTT